MNTVEVKRLLKEKGISYWRIARELNVSENTFYRMMRDRELTPEEERRIMDTLRKMEGSNANE